MDSAVYNMELRQFKELFADEQQIALGDDFCIVNVRYDRQLIEFESPVRLDAYLALFCIGGSVRMSVNMKEFVLEKDQLALLIPGYIGQVVDFDREHKEDIHYVIVGMSRRYLSQLNLDLNRLFAEGDIFLSNPCVKLSKEERAIALRYLQLASGIMESSLSNKSDCLGTLITSFFYLSEGIFSRELQRAKENSVLRSSRSEEIFSKFVRLLAEYHLRERTVSFYADKLCLSPKYFSKLIKNASGRSAPDWIDSFVILEAKNFLRYSDMSIKEIVYRLNFTDQPTFTKFFKAHTGMTPAQFRKS
jgi:AraC-like DNA-binding protein